MKKNRSLYILLNAIILLPILILILFSFIIRFKDNTIFPSYISIDRIFVLTKPTYVKLIFSSIMISFASSILAVTFSLPASYALAYFDFKFKNIILVIALFPILVPPFAYFMGLLRSFSIIGINDTLFGVIISHMILIIPYGIINFKSAFLSIGYKYEEVAKAFGGNVIDRTIYITMPLLKNTIIATVALGFTISFSQYFLTLLVGGGRIKTYALYVLLLIQGNNRALASAASLYYIIINGAFLILISKIHNNRELETL